MIKQMKIENKITKKHKYFTRRDKFIEWLKIQNPDVPENDLRILRIEVLVEKYLPNWFVVVRE